MAEMWSRIAPAMKLCVINAVVMALSSGLTIAQVVSGTPRVIDGDTLDFGSKIVRLHGIDAAESGQRCVGSDHQFTRPGDLAEARLSELVSAGVICQGSSTDDYGRLIAVCSTSSAPDINSLLVAEGLAWAFTKYSSDYVRLEVQAKKTGLGIWSMRCQFPWEFRQKRWNIAIQKAPRGCPIKGNISGNGKIYHTPWSRHYTVTKVSVERGERWFCSEGEALKAGWRPPIR